MNTENVKIRIFDEENRTTLTIKQTTKEDDATYVCKATNEIGMIVTKAKLCIDTSSKSRPTSDIKEEEKLDIKLEKQEEKLHKKKKIELKKAKEIKEKVKAERIKMEKEEIREEKLIPKKQIEEKLVILHFILFDIFHIKVFNLFYL